MQEELMSLACERLKSTESDYEKIAKAWAVELQKLSKQQQIFAKKFINDILFEGQLGNLHRHSVQINPIPSRVSTPMYSSHSTFSNQSAPSPAETYEGYSQSFQQQPSFSQGTSSEASNFFYNLD